MTFVNPLLLAGTALVALPIVLHLIMRRKPRHFEFPALRFIQKRHDANQRRLRLRHLLLLALRVAAIALLALALARPSVKLPGALGSQEGPIAAALVFDTSRRMEYRHENRSRLEVARELGLWLLAQFPRESRIAVIDTRGGEEDFQVDRRAAENRVERLQTVANSQPLADRLGEAVRLLDETELARREIYIFTDMARVSWPKDSALALQKELAAMPNLGVYVIDVGARRPANSALGELNLSSEVLSDRSPLRVETEISHLGPGVQRTVELHLLEPGAQGQSASVTSAVEPHQTDQGLEQESDAQGQAEIPTRTQKRGEKTVTLQPSASQEVQFQVGGLEVGTHQGYVEIVGRDGLACDDRRYFTVEVKPAWRILLAAPEPPESYAFFLTDMLSPKGFRRSGRARFECDVVALDKLDGRGLEPYSAVCLLDPTPLEPDIWRKLGDYVSGGHGLAVFLGRNAADRIESFNEPAAQELLAGKLVRQARSPEGDPFYLAPRNLQHPILAAFRGLAESVPWMMSPVFRYWQLDQPAKGTHVVVPFNDGQPAVLERHLGAGHVLTVTTPVSDDANRQPWNLLPIDSWPFFMLVNQMASYLVGASDQRLNYLAGDPASLRLDPERTFPSYVLTVLDAADEVETRLTPVPGQHELTVSSTDRVGNYRLRAGGSLLGVDRGFSVNLSSEQTRLDRLSDDELADLFGPVSYRLARDRSQIEVGRSMQRVGRELFAMLILLVAVCLGVEHVAANRFYRD